MGGCEGVEPFVRVEGQSRLERELWDECLKRFTYNQIKRDTKQLEEKTQYKKLMVGEKADTVSLQGGVIHALYNL